MSWLEKMEMFNKSLFLEFLRSLSITDDEWVTAKKEGTEKLIQLIQRNNEAMDAKRLKEYLESIELKAKTSFLENWNKSRKQGIWYQQAIGKEYVELFKEQNKFIREVHSVLNGMINDSSFDELPDEVQKVLIQARDDLEAYMKEDNTEDLKILSESCLNDDGSINEEKTKRHKESLEIIKKKIKNVDNIYDKILKTIGNRNSAAKRKLQQARERYEQKTAPILAKVQRLEELQKSMHIDNNTELKAITSNCLGTIDILKSLKKNSTQYFGDEYKETKIKINKLSELIENSVESMLSGGISQYQIQLHFIQESINDFYDNLKEKPIANKLEVDAMVTIQALKNNLSKITANTQNPEKKQTLKQEQKPSYQRTKAEEKFSQRTSNLKEELKGIVKSYEQPNLECAHQENSNENQEYENTMLALLEPLEEVYKATFDEIEDSDITEISHILNHYKERELSMDNILDLEEKLNSCFDNLTNASLKIKLINSWESEKQEIIEDYDLLPHKPSI